MHGLLSAGVQLVDHASFQAGYPRVDLRNHVQVGCVRRCRCGRSRDHVELIPVCELKDAIWGRYRRRCSPDDVESARGYLCSEGGGAELKISGCSGCGDFGGILVLQVSGALREWQKW